MRILVVRLSAMGDIVQTLPAITDLRRLHPHATIDVATDERFADLVNLHAGVDRVISIALKRWKKNLLDARTWKELRATLSSLRSKRYDIVLDLHGLNKSAIVSWLARGRLKLGPPKPYCGEALAPWFYDRAFDNPSVSHPVPRMREFVTVATAGAVTEPLDFGLRARWTGQSSRQVALLHSTSGDHKLWPEASWIGLGQHLAAQGFELLLPWGSPSERARAVRLAQAIGEPHCVIGEPLSIAHWAERLTQCRLVVGVDTGLTHLAAAAGVPCLALFIGTESVLFAPQDPARAAFLDGCGTAPALQDVLSQVQLLLECDAAPSALTRADNAVPAAAA